MSTKIWSADIIIGTNNEQPVVLKNEPVKRLPVKILFSNDELLTRIINKIGEKRWTGFQINRDTRLPKIRIHYIKELGTVNNEPQLHEHGC